MSTLQESVDARRAAKPTELGCVVVAAQGPALMLCAWRGQSWALPWSHLIAAQFDEVEGHEELRLSFTGHAVTVHGHNLRCVLDDVAGFRVACLREAPTEYRSRSAADEPFIIRIEVTASETAK